MRGVSTEMRAAALSLFALLWGGFVCGALLSEVDTESAALNPSAVAKITGETLDDVVDEYAFSLAVFCPTYVLPIIVFRSPLCPDDRFEIGIGWCATQSFFVDMKKPPGS